MKIHIVSELKSLSANSKTKHDNATMMSVVSDFPFFLHRRNFLFVIPS